MERPEEATNYGRLTAIEQGAASDRPQGCRFCGFSAQIVVGCNGRAAGELGR